MFQIFDADLDMSKSAPTSPSIPSRSLRTSSCKVNSHFMLSLDSEPRNCRDWTSHHESLLEFPRDKLKIIERLGDGHFGDVHLCEVHWQQTASAFSDCNLVVVDTLRSEKYRDEFERRVRAIARLRDVNVSQLVGACLRSEPYCYVTEYCEMGDMCQFLQNHVAETATPLTSSASTLR